MGARQVQGREGLPRAARFESRFALKIGSLLALKLLLVPSFLAMVSFAARRWGPGVAGWLAGLPLVTGPILLFLAIEHGAGFSAQTAVTSLAAVLAALCFNLAYAWTALRCSWPVSLAAGVGAWFAAAAALAQLPASPWLSLAVAVFALGAAPGLFPVPTEPPIFTALPKGELLARMAAGAALTLLVTTAASRIGPAWSGVFAVFPLLSIVLAVSSHASNGSAFTVILLRAMARGLCSLAAFCFCLALLLPSQGLPASFSLSLSLALCVQWFVKKRLGQR